MGYLEYERNIMIKGVICYYKLFHLVYATRSKLNWSVRQPILSCFSKLMGESLSSQLLTVHELSFQTIAINPYRG